MSITTDAPMATNDTAPRHRRPLLVYIISAVYLITGLKELLAGIGGPILIGLYKIEEVRREIVHQPNSKEIFESARHLQDITKDRFVFATLGGLVEVLAAFYLFKMKKRGLTLVIIGLGISLISPLTHGIFYGWPVGFGKNGFGGFLTDWVISLLVVFYLWMLLKDQRLT